MVYLKIKRKAILIIMLIYQSFRRFFYRCISENKEIGISINKIQPTQLNGKGEIITLGKVNVGFMTSPFFINGYSYIEARCKESQIIFGDNFNSNNNLRVIAEKGKIIFGENVLIGSNVEIINSDFHHIDPIKRNLGVHKSKDLIIKDNVFIGSNVVILKGVTVGPNSVIANGSVVFDDIASNSIVKGNPAIVFKTIIYGK